MENDHDLRRAADDYLDRGLWLEAHSALGKICKQGPNAATAAYLVSRYEHLRGRLPYTICRLAVLRSFTVEPLVPFVRAAAFVNNLDLNIQLSPFNAYAQEFFNQSSALYQFDPQVTILALQTRDVAPDLWESSADRATTYEAAADRVVRQFEEYIRAFRAHTDSHLLVHNLEMPSVPSQGILDAQLEGGQGAAIQRVNRELRRIASEHKGVYILDYDGLIARHGRDHWHDERKWLAVRMPMRAENLIHVAEGWLRWIHPLVGKLCKAVVIDLDNTLWGGVIGEDGIDGIKLGPEYPGAAFQAVQRALLDLYGRGILLAVCSKNNYADAMEVLQTHPGMLLKPEHFAALRINWNDKAQSLQQIAEELNIGIDTLAFLDDNPVERERIRGALPEVTVIDLPDQPMEFARALREVAAFERLSLTDEDRERGRYYTEQRQRVELEREAASLEDFYASLAQEVKVASPTGEALVRVAQLTQKTNQFNLTTRRYTEQQIADLSARADWRTQAAWVKDRFGDNGLVAVIITHDEDGICEIDTFLMSCRVVGRTVETAILSFLADSARRRGMNRLQGWYIPTKKNSLAREFYANHKFQMQKEHGGETLWAIDLSEITISCPPWIKLVGEREAPR